MDNNEHAYNGRPLPQAFYISDTFYMALEKKYEIWICFDVSFYLVETLQCTWSMDRLAGWLPGEKSG